MNLRLHIERLVLDGLPLSRAEGVRVKVAIEAELGRLFSEGSIAPDLRSDAMLPSVAAEPMQVSWDGSPATLGTQVARSLFAGVAATMSDRS